MKEPPLVQQGTLEAIKWLALVLMLGDHVNKFLFLGTLPILSEAGRLAFPLFAGVLAYNLARPGALERGVYSRVMVRLALVGALATVPYMALDAGFIPGHWWPLNAMFTLLAITASARLLEAGKLSLGIAALAVVLLAGALPEFCWAGVLFGLAVWWYCKRQTLLAAGFVVLCCAALWYFNRNMWALAALPVLVAALHSKLNLSRLPRLKWAFYAFYPAHLAALWLIRIPMRAAGYIFI